MLALRSGREVHPRAIHESESLACRGGCRSKGDGSGAAVRAGGGVGDGGGAGSAV